MHPRCPAVRPPRAHDPNSAAPPRYAGPLYLAGLYKHSVTKSQFGQGKTDKTPESAARGMPTLRALLTTTIQHPLDQRKEKSPVSTSCAADSHWLLLWGSKIWTGL